MSQTDALKTRAHQLQLHGLLAHWAEIATAEWLPRLLQWEEAARQQRSLDRRVRAARIGRFKPLCDFDGTGPNAATAGSSRV